MIYFLPSHVLATCQNAESLYIFHYVAGITSPYGNWATGQPRNNDSISGNAKDLSRPLCDHKCVQNIHLI